MTTRSSHYVKGPVVSILAALAVAAAGCLGPAEAHAEPLEGARAGLASAPDAPGAVQTIGTALLYINDASHTCDNSAAELTDPAGADVGEAVNYIDEAAYDLTVARSLLVNRGRYAPHEVERLRAELEARQRARAARIARSASR